jgi:hypothetical protein
MGPSVVAQPRGVDATLQHTGGTFACSNRRCEPGCRWVGGIGTATQGGFVTTTETGSITGTKDKDYNIIWFTEVCLNNVLRLETYIKDAEREKDEELAEFFRRAQSESRKGAEQGKSLLAARLK